MKHQRPIAFEFVDAVPAAREEGKLYISLKYRTAIHSCLCGCGMKVVTPLTHGLAIHLRRRYRVPASFCRQLEL